MSNQVQQGTARDGFAAREFWRWIYMSKTFLSLVLLLASFTGLAAPIALPSSGRVYLEKAAGLTSEFSPLGGVLLVAARLRSCEAIPGSRSIDEYLLRTDSSGFYQIPEKTIDLRQGCTVTLLAQVVSPFLRSLPARVAGHPDVGQPQRYSGLEHNDVVARQKQDRWHKHEDGQLELEHWLSSVIGQARISGEERRTAYLEMLPEICRVLLEDPSATGLDHEPNFGHVDLECATQDR